MTGYPRCEKKRCRYLYACAVNAIVVLITGIALMVSLAFGNTFNFCYTRGCRYVHTPQVLLVMFIFLGIESIGMFGTFYRRSCLTITYICLDIVQIISICIQPYNWWYSLFVVFLFLDFFSLISALLFLVSLSHDSPRRQLNRITVTGSTTASTSV